MTKKKEKRGRKALPPERKKPPQPTIKINAALFPFVKLLKTEYKDQRVSPEKLDELTRLLLGNDAVLLDTGISAKKPDNKTEEESKTVSYDQQS